MDNDERKKQIDMLEGRITELPRGSISTKVVKGHSTIIIGGTRRV